MGFASTDSKDGMVNFIFNAINKSIQEISTSNMATITAINDDKTKIDVTIDSTKQEVPELPFITLQGGGSFLQFPISVGDKVLVVFAKDTTEDWLDGKEDFIYDSNFDINNGFALVGINNDSNPVEIQYYTDLKVNTIKIRNESEELITILSETLQLLSDTNDTLSGATTTISGTPYPLDQQSTFSGFKADADSLKARLDTFKV